MKVLTYDEVAKEFYLVGAELWRFGKVVSNGRVKVARRVIFNDKYKYYGVRLNGRMVYYHRLIYCLHNKADIPISMVIDHIDNDQSNNLPDNLQLVTHTLNNSKDSIQSLPKPIKGGKYRLRFCYKLGSIHIGVYNESDWIKYNEILTTYKCGGINNPKLEGLSDIEIKQLITGTIK